jgi:hypothetical protein
MLAAEEANVAARAPGEVGAVVARLIDGTRLEYEVVRSYAVLLVAQMADVDIDCSVLEHLESVISGYRDVMGKVFVKPAV